jgi:hypothetical protein
VTPGGLPCSGGVGVLVDQAAQDKFRRIRSLADGAAGAAHNRDITGRAQAAGGSMLAQIGLGHPRAQATLQGFLAIPAYPASMPRAPYSTSAVGHHSSSGTTPGPVRSRPSKKRATCPPVRIVIGVDDIWL